MIVLDSPKMLCNGLSSMQQKSLLRTQVGEELQDNQRIWITICDKCVGH